MPRSLAQHISRRLELAGITEDDPALVRIREWNRAAYAAGRYRVELRRGQFGQTRVIENKRLDVPA